MRTAFLLLVAVAMMPGQTLHGIVDIHAHSDPDSVPRSIDALSLVKLAKEKGYRGLVLKNHYESTAAWAAMARAQTPGIEVFGGIALNRTVGGVNPAAVERMTRVQGGYGKVVWMPTFDAENHVRVTKESRPFVSVSRGGKLLPEVLEVLDIIAKNKMVLATGHSSPEESLILIREARKRGAAGIVVTHPLIKYAGMNTAQMKEAAHLGAMLEFVCNAVLGINKEWEPDVYVRSMREVGFANIVLSSDYGQKGNPLHPDGMVEIFRLLRARGVTEAEINLMAKQNPSKLLGM
ncbi:MAG: hypothetical protein HYZ37_09580 [Candidatus Solibacter usitatus]|nr:hypothetical protein [Candidatus Solibacter usitatus]